MGGGGGGVTVLLLSPLFFRKNWGPKAPQPLSPPPWLPRPCFLLELLCICQLGTIKLRLESNSYHDTVIFLVAKLRPDKHKIVRDISPDTRLPNLNHVMRFYPISAESNAWVIMSNTYLQRLLFIKFYLIIK